MKNPDEDFGYEQRRQARIDAEAWGIVKSTPWHQKVGTKVAFSRTADRDPWPRIPLSLSEPLFQRPTRLEALLYAIAWGFAIGIVVLV